jgi:hypothetical protein
MKKLSLIVVVMVLSLNAMPGQPSMNEPNWDFQSQDTSLTINTIFSQPTPHLSKPSSLSDIISLNAAKEFNSTITIPILNQIKSTALKAEKETANLVLNWQLSH